MSEATMQTRQFSDDQIANIWSLDSAQTARLREIFTKKPLTHNYAGITPEQLTEKNMSLVQMMKVCGHIAHHQTHSGQHNWVRYLSRQDRGHGLRGYARKYSLENCFELATIGTLSLFGIKPGYGTKYCADIKERGWMSGLFDSTDSGLQINAGRLGSAISIVVSDAMRKFIKTW